MDVQGPTSEEGVNKKAAPRGHTTGVEEESDEVTAMPLIKRRSNGRKNEARNGRYGRSGRALRKEMKRYGNQNLQIILRRAMRGNRWRWLMRTGIVIGNATRLALARTTVAATFWGVRLAVA